MYLVRIIRVRTLLVQYIWYCCTLTEVRSLLMILGRSCHVLCSGFLVGPRTSITNENECKRVACHIASRLHLHTLLTAL